MTNEALVKLLADVRDGNASVEDGMDRWRELPFLDLRRTKFDPRRILRNGLPEVIHGEGKTPEQVGEIFRALAGRANILATRVSPGMAAHVLFHRGPHVAPHFGRERSAFDQLPEVGVVSEPNGRYPR